ncbi:response regulator transcription factor [Caminibacter profundus]
MKILLIEDDEKILSFLQKGLKEDGHSVEIAKNGEDGEYLAKTNNYDVIILDWMLPKKSGIEVLNSIREEINTPILMLTAIDEVEDKVTCLKLGADDYLTKPFAYEELEARILALYRRSITKGSNFIEIKDIKIDINNKILLKNEKSISLSAKEWELLLFLIKNKNSIISNEMIENQLWADVPYMNSNVIAVTIYHLRKKIGKDIIKSYRGLGYKIEI